MSDLSVAGDVATELRSRPARWRWPSLPWPAIGAVGVSTILIAAHARRYGRWIVDDAAITFAYARNLAEGNGLVLQPGSPPVEGFSNITWLALLTVGRWLGLFDRGSLFGVPDYVLYPKTLALLCSVGILITFYSAATLLTKHPALVTLAAGAGLSRIPSFVIWSFSGLENSLYALLVGTLAAILLRAVLTSKLLSGSTAVLCGLVALLAALTRPDGVIYAAACPAVMLVRGARRHPLRVLSRITLTSLTFLIPYAAVLAVRHAMFGTWMPNTALAKGQSVPQFEDVGRAADLIRYIGWPAVIVLLSCTGIAFARPALIRTGAVPLLVMLGLAVAAYCCLTPDWMGQYRFATPVWTLGTLTGTLVTAHLLGKFRTRGRIGLTLVLVFAVARSGQHLHAYASTARAHPTVPMCTVADRYGRIINGYADMLGLKHGSLLAPDIGGTALTSRLAIIDLTGLADSRLARDFAARDMAGLRDQVFTTIKPTFIHVHGHWAEVTGLPSDRRLPHDYDLVAGTPGASADQDWIRKDGIANPAQLAALRTYAATTIRLWDNDIAQAPLRSCGNTLRPGQTLH